MFKTEFEPNFDALTVELDKPSLQALAHILRHRELWPAGFKWDFRKCDTCAIGMANKLWFRLTDAGNADHALCEVCQLPSQSSAAIFQYGMYDSPCLITPEIVADRIDAYLAARTAP